MLCLVSEFLLQQLLGVKQVLEIKMT